MILCFFLHCLMQTIMFAKTGSGQTRGENSNRQKEDRFRRQHARPDGDGRRSRGVPAAFSRAGAHAAAVAERHGQGSLHLNLMQDSLGFHHLFRSILGARCIFDLGAKTRPRPLKRPPAPRTGPMRRQHASATLRKQESASSTAVCDTAYRITCEGRVSQTASPPCPLLLPPALPAASSPPSFPSRLLLVLAALLLCPPFPRADAIWIRVLWRLSLLACLASGLSRD